jgi:hypothetical protein
MRTLAGLTSRWTTPAACAASSASATAARIEIASSTAIGPATMRSRSVLAVSRVAM